MARLELPSYPTGGYGTEITWTTLEDVRVRSVRYHRRSDGVPAGHRTYLSAEIQLDAPLAPSQLVHLPAGYSYIPESLILHRYDRADASYPITGANWTYWKLYLDENEDPLVHLDFDRGQSSYCYYMLTLHKAFPNMVDSGFDHLDMDTALSERAVYGENHLPPRLLSELISDPWCAPISDAFTGLGNYRPRRRRRYSYDEPVKDPNKVMDFVNALLPRALRPVVEAPKPKTRGARAMIWDEEDAPGLVAQLDPSLFHSIWGGRLSTPRPGLLLGLSPSLDSYRPYRGPEALREPHAAGYLHEVRGSWTPRVLVWRSPRAFHMWFTRVAMLENYDRRSPRLPFLYHVPVAFDAEKIDPEPTLIRGLPLSLTHELRKADRLTAALKWGLNAFIGECAKARRAGVDFDLYSVKQHREAKPKHHHVTTLSPVRTRHDAPYLPVYYNVGIDNGPALVTVEDYVRTHMIVDYGEPWLVPVPGEEVEDAPEEPVVQPVAPARALLL